MRGRGRNRRRGMAAAVLVCAAAAHAAGPPVPAAAAPGEYSLADESYATLLAKLSTHKFDKTSSELRDNILQFYADPVAPIETKKDPARWQAVQTDLSQLETAPPAPAPARPGPG